MNTATILTVEWFKTRRRLAFWAAMLAFFAMLFIGFGASYYFATRSGRASNGTTWDTLVSAGSGFGLLILLVAIILLTGAERGWRTERQNIIDGLSRTQYFTGKLLLVIGLALLMWLGGILLATIFEMLNRALPGALAQPFITRTDLLLLGGLLLYFLVVGTIALLFGTVSASSGSGLALAFLFLFAQTPIMFIMAQQGGVWQSITPYLPTQVLSSLVTAAAYDDNFKSAMESMRLQKAPLRLSASTAAPVAILYAAICSAGAWYSIRKRDL